jgi:hypothetical protein
VGVAVGLLVAGLGLHRALRCRRRSSARRA